MRRSKKLLLFEDFMSIGKELRQKVEKYITKNKKELDSLADEDKFDEIYQHLYIGFDIEPDSPEGKDLKQAFDSIF
tara:strand:- start:109 stop:336 length:228 start_codon:yes stop_codon:yes gene_type:complete